LTREPVALASTWTLMNTVDDAPAKISPSEQLTFCEA
jgi:hypothetical protein